MKNFALGIKLLLNRPWNIAGYVIIMTALVIFIAAGMEVTGPHSAEFWHCKLVHFHIDGEMIVKEAYMEFIGHLWWIALVVLSGYAFNDLLYSYDRSFENFARLSKKSRLYFEGLRISVILIKLGAILFPFLFAAAIGYFNVNLDKSQVIKLLCSTISSLIFITGVFYALCWSEDFRPFCKIVVILPIFTSGIQYYLHKAEWVSEKYLILPYSPYSTPSERCNAIIISAIVFLAVIILLRAVGVCRTKRIATDCGAGEAAQG